MSSVALNRKPLEGDFNAWEARLRSVDFGRQTRSNVAVGLTLVNLARKLECTFIRPGQLEISRLAGVGQPTVSKVLKRLTTFGFIERDHQGRRLDLQADTWNLLFPETHERTWQPEPRSLLLLKRIWTQHALGSGKYKVYRVLESHSGEPVSNIEIAKEAALKRRTAIRHLRALHDLGMIHAPERSRCARWLRLNDTQTDELLQDIRQLTDFYAKELVCREKIDALRAEARTGFVHRLPESHGQKMKKLRLEGKI